MYTFKTKGTCARSIDVDVDENDVVTHVQFYGGCDGNLKAIGKLISGMKADDVIALLRGNTCGPKATSCADQLTYAIEEAIASKNA